MNEQSIREIVQEKYGQAALQVAKGGSACCGSTCSGVDPITANLYPSDDTAGLPPEAIAVSLGCGNPTALADLQPGETVLDLGSGGGIDVLLSAKRVGPTGKAYGLDMTEEMLALARENQRKAGVVNVEFLKGEIENIPLPDNSVDVIISNCVINLSGNKDRVLSEAFRVLKTGGRFAVSDVVVRGEVPAPIRRNVELWIGCVAGALTEEEYRTKLARAGFADVDVEPTRIYRVDDAREFLAQSGLDVDEIAPHIDGKFMSAFVCARKPLTVTRAPRLSHKEKELVAVGAAVAAGCRPCTEYHMKEVQAAGATTEEITHALDAALCVKGSTTGIMERVAYAALGRPKDAQPACCSGPTDRMKELVSIGAAVAVNCPENFQKHVETSRAFGVREEEIRLVIGLAKAIRSKASEKMDAAATNQSATAQEQTESCCGATSAQQKTEQTEPTAGTCCGPAVSRQSPAQATPTTKGSCC